MKKLFLSALLAAIAAGSHAQPMISSGFVTGMASINGTTYTHPGNIGTGNYQYVCASKNEGHFFAASFNRSMLYYIDQTANNIVDSMPVTLYDMTAANENSNLFGIGNLDSLYRINTATKTIVGGTVLPGIWRVRERPNAQELWATANNKIYVVNYASGFTSRVYKINTATHAITDSSAQLPSGQYCEVVSHDSSKVFVSAPNRFRIYVLNATTLALMDSINTGTREPFMLYRHPYRNELWAVNHFKDSVTVYDEATYAQIATFGIASSPHHLAFGKDATAVHETGKGAEQVSIYPNPASTQLNINMPGATKRTITVYDVYGRKLTTTETSANTATIDVAALAPGLYYLTVQEGDKQTTLSWIKS